MFLKSLKIYNGAVEIRTINFHAGLNLIIDETPTENRQESGNNVGKTTVLRLIDFCFGSSGENVYKDTEFKDKTNTQIHDFLIRNNIIIELNLTNSFEETGNVISIKRNFLSGKQKIQQINEEQILNRQTFTARLKEVIFNSKSPRPSFREIISRNIRYEKQRLENTLKVLHPFATLEDYEALYLFWFGLDSDTLARKQQLTSAKGTEESIIKGLKRYSSLSEINQALSVIDNDINELEIQKSEFRVNENYKDDVNKLQNIKGELLKLSHEMNRLRLRRQLILHSKSELEKEISKIDIQQLQSIYQEADVFIDRLQKRFEELLSFHNNLIKEKVAFITTELPTLDKEIENINYSITGLLEDERQVTHTLANAGALEELERMILDLNTKYEQRGKYTEQQTRWVESNNRLEEIEKELNQINEGLASKDEELERKIKLFNQFFSKISAALYNEQFILSQQKNERAIELKVSAIGGNLGTGKKKGQIAAFDISYIQFCDEQHIQCLHFLLYDQIETVHDNQLVLLADLVSKLNIQLIVPILKDKLPFEINSEIYKILTLSQSEKLFRI